MPPPYHYSNIERCDMVRLYYQTNNTYRAKDLFHERYPNLPVPTHGLILRMVQNLRDYGQFTVPTHAQARGGQHRDLERLDRRILNYFARDPRRSTRKASRRYHVSQSYVWRLLNATGLHPYHYQPVQDMSPDDFPLRRQFCQWLLENEQANILWTDESSFTRIGLFNVHRLNSKLDLYPLSYVGCKNILRRALQKMTYDDTENLLIVVK